MTKFATAPLIPVEDDTRAWMADGIESDATDLPVDGALPPWLEGTLLRNGAAAHGGGAARHQLDGSALLHRFAFRGGRVDYTSRFLRTKSRAALQEGRIAYREFASDPCRRFAEPIASVFSPRYTDNANVNVVRLGEQFLALTETPLPVAFDPATLATLGVAEPPPGRGARSPSAHPHVDPVTGDWLTTQVQFGARCSYRVYHRPADGRRARQLAKIPVAEPSYLHSFALTERYVVLAEIPFRVRPLDLLGGARPFIQSYRWQPELGTTLLVLDRSTGDVVSRHQAPAWFTFHHVNAFDDGTGLVLDLSTYDDATLIDALYLDAMQVPGATIPVATLRRLRIRPGTTADATTEVLTDTPFEWPRVRASVDGRPYLAAYGIGLRQESFGPVATITKVDTVGGGAHHWSEPRAYPGEPVFVPAPTNRAEDDGALLSVVFDAATGGSYLLVLDARDLTELARVHAPNRIPFGFHGDFFAE